MGIVVVAKQSSNLEKLKASLANELTSRMNRPRTRCSRRLRGAGTETLYKSNVKVPSAMSRALLEKDIKVGSVVTGIPTKKFNQFTKHFFYVDSHTEYHVGFNARLGQHVGLGAATVRDLCNEKVQIVVVAKQSSNLEKLKASLANELKSTMKRPSTRCR